MEISDLVGLKEPLIKLIEVVAQGCGNISRPFLTRRNADALAYEIRQLAAATQDAKTIGIKVERVGGEITMIPYDDAQLSLAERAQSREQYQQARQQQNIEQITAHAAENLSHEESVSESPVEPDWISRFFDAAKHVSNEEMQLIWGKILAGEVKRPYSYSLRTLDILRNLSTDEAATLNRVAQYCCLAYRDNVLAPVLVNVSAITDEGGFYSFPDLLLLVELGMISDNLRIKYPSAESADKIPLIFGSRLLLIQRPEKSEFSLPIRALTKTGAELYRLMQIVPPKSYIDYLTEYLISLKCSVTYAHLLKVQGNRIELHEESESW